MVENRKHAREFATKAIAERRPLSWFEELYQFAEGDANSIPWADLKPNPNFSLWLEREKLDGLNKSALVVGCGLGDDAELLSSLGFHVTGFDISKTCTEWSEKRFPDSKVEYLVADVLQPPEDWKGNFDFIFEAYTLQVLPEELRQPAMSKIAACLKSRGQLLVVSRGRDEDGPPGNMPWPLLRSELQSFEPAGLTEVNFEDYVEAEDPPVRRFRVEYTNRN